MINELKPILAGVASMVIVDLHTFYVARQSNPEVKFRWDLFLVRAAMGVCVGFGASSI